MTPQGYLNLGGEQSSTLWYSPKTGNSAIVDGSLVCFTSGPTDAVGLSVCLAGLAPWSVHDVFLGTSLVLSAWNDATPSVTLSRFNGLPVNPENNDLWLGSIMIGPTDGVARCDLSRGLGRVWSVYNAFNQEDIVLEAGTTQADTSPSGAYYPANDGVTRPVFNDHSNNATLVIGRSGPRVVAEMDMNRRCTFNKAIGDPNAQHWFGIGWNSQDTISGFGGNLNLELGQSITYEVQGCTEHAGYVPPPFQGAATAWALECQRWGHSGGEWNIPFNFRLLLRWRG